ncbi:MAG: histidine phosphatase family protein [Pseudomonadota bacterium]
MAVVFLRHTKPKIDASICYGRLDVDVAETFEQDLKDVLRQLPAVTRIVSSPLRRALRLAQRIAAVQDTLVCVDDRVQEMDFGSWEGCAWSAIPRMELDAWAADFMDARAHGGENVRDFQRRCLDALNDYRNLSGDTLVVCHAGVVRAAFATGEHSADFTTRIDYGATRLWCDKATLTTDETRA